MNQSAGKSPKIINQLQEEINEEIHPFLQKILDHLKEIAIVLVVIILGAGLITGYRFYKKSSLKDARAKFNKILAQKRDKEQLKQLDHFAKEAPAELRQAVLLELANRAVKLQEYSQAAAYWQALAQESQEKPIKIIAHMGQAKALAHTGDLTASLNILSTTLKNAPKDFKRSINFELAGIAEKAKDWSKALKAYEALKAEAALTNANQEFLDFKIKQLQKRLAKEKS